MVSALITWYNNLLDIINYNGYEYDASSDEDYIEEVKCDSKKKNNEEQSEPKLSGTSWKPELEVCLKSSGAKKDDSILTTMYQKRKIGRAHV